MPSERDVFKALTALILERAASPEELERFRELLRSHPEFIEIYRRQVLMATLLPALPARELENGDDVDTRQSAIGLLGRYRNWRRVGWMAAAAAVLLLGGIAILQCVSPTSDLRLPTSDLRPLISALRSPTSVAPVKLVSQSGVKGLDLPEALPGRMRLESGVVVVRLASDVELTVLGPADLEILDCMQVRLEHGKLLANVPHTATGFVVFATELEICDLGTVFGVSVGPGSVPAAGENISDVFVFKGSVQVSESRECEWGTASLGGCVRICKAGEGVRLIAGERSVKITADKTEVGRLFDLVKDQVAADSVAALAAVEKIADGWVDRYMPEKSSRVAARRLAVAPVPKVPFRKTAWVRPSVSLQQEASNMKTTSAAAVLVAATMAAGSAAAFSGPVFVNTFPDRNRCWETVYTNAVPLAWSWNWVTNTASSVQLDIVGMGGSVTTNFASPATNWVWQAFAQSTPSAEDVYALTITFHNDGGSVVGALTSRLSVVSGAFGQALVDPDPSSAAWSKVKENVVIPYDAGWTEATAAATNSRVVIAKVGGATQTNALTDASGYFGWKIKHSDWGYGTFNLALTFPEMVTNGWDATLTRVPDGLMFSVR